MESKKAMKGKVSLVGQRKAKDQLASSLGSLHGEVASVAKGKCDRLNLYYVQC